MFVGLLVRSNKYMNGVCGHVQKAEACGENALDQTQYLGKTSDKW